jgi:hypothetical protein
MKALVASVAILVCGARVGAAQSVVSPYVDGKTLYAFEHQTSFIADMSLFRSICAPDTCSEPMPRRTASPTAVLLA